MQERPHLLGYPLTLLPSSMPLFLTKASLSNWLSLGIELSNLNGNLEGPPLVTGGNACLLGDSYSIRKLEL